MAVQAALRHRRSPEHHLAEEPGAPALNEHVVKALTTNRTGPTTENEAANTLQYAAARAFIGRNISFQRMKLLQRIQLELQLMRGLRLLFWCMCMFAVVVYACMLEKQGHVQFGLLRTFNSPALFRMDQDSLGEIRSPEALFDYLKEISAASRKLLPRSSDYMSEEVSEIKVVAGVKSFQQGGVIMNVAGIAPRIDSPSFSIVAWVQLRPGSGSNLLRKPVGSSLNSKGLTCWGFHVGAPEDTFTFGAHDFQGAEATEDLEHVVTSGLGSSNVTDGRMHYVALVVDQDSFSANISFYVDAKLQGLQKTRRPVTDCAPTALEVGGAGVVQIAELTVISRKVSVNEMREIMSSGYTLQSLADGKLPFQTDETEFDAMRSSQTVVATQAEQEREQRAYAAEVQAALSLAKAEEMHEPAAGSILESHSILDKVKSTASSSCNESWDGGTSCNMIDTDWSQSIRQDPQNGNKSFYEVIPRSARPDSAPGQTDEIHLKLSGSYPAITSDELIHFNPETYPSFCGQSVTFAGWFKQELFGTSGLFSFIQSFYTSPRDPVSKKNVPWGQATEENHKIFKMSIPNYAGQVSQLCWNYRSHMDEPAILQWGACKEFPGSSLPTGEWRHVAFVFDVEAHTFEAYLDGAQGIESTSRSSENYLSKSDVLSDLGCGFNTAQSYIGLGHRVPGMFPFRGGISDYRMYVGHALSAEEIRRLAQDPAKKKCESFNLGGDAMEVDTFGKDCSWYEATKALYPWVCDSSFARSKCSFGCGVVPTCAEDAGTGKVPIHNIFDRIMLMKRQETSSVNAVLCARQGYDVVAECKKMDAKLWSKETLRTKYGSASWPHEQDRLVPAGYLDMLDCEQIQAALNPHCSFSVPDMWTRQMQRDVTANGGHYSIKFWMKPLDNFLDSFDAAQPLTLYQSLSPPVLLTTIYISKTGGKLQLQWYVFSGMCEPAQQEETDVDMSAWENRWMQISLIFGATSGSGKSMLLVGDAAPSIDAADFSWCLPAGIDDPEMIQGIQFPSNMLVSPLEVSAQALGLKAAQTSFYSQRRKYQQRIGPRVSDVERMDSRIEYDRRTYSYPLFLVGPPILLQSRAAKTANCSRSTLGHDLQVLIWNGIVKGNTCAAPFLCDQDLMLDSTALMACSAEDSPNSFLGRTPKMLDGDLQFAEFLMSITDSPLLVRNETVYPTASYIDAQTRQITVKMVAFSPDVGVASTIQIMAEFTTELQVTAQVEHYQGLEGAVLDEYTLVTFAGCGLAALIGIDKVLTVRYMDWQAEKGSFLVDMLLQVILPVTYFVVRYFQILRSGEQILNIIGTEGLAGVPWADTEVALEAKIDRFFAGLQKFSDTIAIESIMKLVYFIHATCALVRLIIQTSAHPRTAILVKTLIRGFDDLWHFLLLLSILFAGFMTLALAQFSGSNASFATTSAAFETLYDMMLGGLPEGWVDQPILMIFVIFFNVLVFLTMLNFIIAIIVDSYAVVNEEVKALESHQEFFTDLVGVIWTSVNPKNMGWPGHLTLQEGLEESKKITLSYMDFRKMFPRFTMKSLQGFINTYARQEYMIEKPDISQILHGDVDMTGIEEFERRVCVLLKVPQTTLAERIIRLKALNVTSALEGRGPAAAKMRRQKSRTKELGAPSKLGDGLEPDIRKATAGDAGNQDQHAQDVKKEMSDMDRLEQKMQEQHDNLLAALQSLRGGGDQFYGQGSRNQEVVIQPPPRQSMQAQHSTAHNGAKEVSTDPGDSAAAATAFPQLVFWH